MTSKTTNRLDTDEARALIKTFEKTLDTIRVEVRKVIIGQEEVVDNLLMTLLVGGALSDYWVARDGKDIASSNLSFGAGSHV